MKRRRWAGLVAALFLALALFSAWGVRRYFAPRPEAVPVEIFLPTRVSAALRISGFENAFLRHWMARGRDDTDAAALEVLKAMGIWEGWVSQYSESGARTRIGAYRKAVFQLLGREAWIVFGEWAAPGLEGTGDAALLVFILQDSPIKAHLGPLAELFFPGNKLQSFRYANQRIYEFIDADNRRAMTATELGGWICVSIRSSDTEPIKIMIDRFNEARRTGTIPKLVFDDDTEGETRSAISALLRPSMIWGQIRQFNQQLKQPTAEATENLISAWAQRLERIDEIRLRQSGRSLLNLDLTLSGDRIRTLETVRTDNRTLKLEEIPNPRVRPETLSPTLAQADFSYPFIVGAPSLVGFEWEDLLNSLKGVRWVSPVILKKLTEKLTAEVPPTGGRLGLAFYPTAGAPIPVLSLWQDESPLLKTASSPADAWRLLPDPAKPGEGDLYYTAGVELYNEPTTTTLANAQRALCDNLWNSGTAPPLGFVSIHLDKLFEWMDSFPAILLKKDDRAQWIIYRSFVHGWDLMAGSVALRLDRKGDELILKMRTLEL